MLNLTPEQIYSMPPDERRRLLALSKDFHGRIAQNLFFHLYPDTDKVWQGPSLMGGLVQPGQVLHARSGYPRHMEWLAAGATHRERCAMFGNRCITPWTYLETPAGEALSAAVLTSEDARVVSWDGESRCVGQARAGYLKSIEPAFRVVLDTGRFFDCSREHRVLTVEGWLSLDQLVSRASGLRCWHTREDYVASCVAGGYLGDRRPLSVGGIDLVPPPSRGDARARGRLLFELPDEAEHRLQRIRASQESDRLSNPDDLRRLADLFALFAGAASSRRVLSLAANSLAVAQLAAELGRDPPAGSAPPADQCGDDVPRGAALRQSRAGSCRRTLLSAAALVAAQSCDVQGPGGSTQEWRRDDRRTAIFFPSNHPSLIGGNRIIAIIPLGYQPIIDAHVPVTNSYFAGGAVHHNCGKTFGLGGYETACHLTGLYPGWWEGRRFAHPISAWAAGDTYETTRDIVQLTLLGEIGYEGTNNGPERKGMDGRGIIPGRLLGRNTWRSGVQDLVDTIAIKHVSGGTSVLSLKSYDQGRKAFQGTGRHVIWFDEEPPMDVYNEALIRTGTLGGITMLTFTPLSGLSEVVLSFMPADQRPDLST